MMLYLSKAPLKLYNMLVIFMGSHLIYFYNNYNSTIDHKMFQYLKSFQKSFNWGDKCCPVILHSLFTLKIVMDIKI